MKKILLFVLPFVLLACSSDDSSSSKDNNEKSKEEKEIVEPEVEVTVIPDEVLNEVLADSFNDLVDVKKGGKTYAYLLKMAEEAVAQVDDASKYGLPLLYKEENFPTAYNYYTDKKRDKVAICKTMVGWLSAMQLSELFPLMRNLLYKAGYEAGGYNMKSYLYGYSFKGDPNVARLVASGIYSAMHTILGPDTDSMRAEVEGSKYSKTLAEIYEEESRLHVDDDAFYVNLRRFLACAPGPYMPIYAFPDREERTFPDEKSSNRCLKVDMDIYKYIVENYNLPDQRAVQAIADVETDVQHLFGSDKKDVGGKYDFNAVFGPSTIGETIKPDGKTADFITLIQKVGSAARGVFQNSDPTYARIEYGRLRPGCSEEQQGLRKSYTDDRLNILTCFIIEDNDGHKASYEEGDLEKYYYDENGNWTHKDVQSIEQYEDLAKDKLYANSYPSGHSSSIWAAAMTLMELYPQKADLIMRAANDFALSRAISRYHWNSDVIQGKIIGSIINPVCHATSDYDTLLETARAEL